MSGSGAIGRWLAGRRTTAAALPGRPPALPYPPPRKAETVTRAVCCSGGGIRSAAFSLGGMQGLQRPVRGESWYDGVDLVTSVSGGGYLAGSMALVNHHLIEARKDRGRPAERTESELPPYAVGSPEDNRLRNHTRYLVDDVRLAALGVLSIVYGLLLNLLPILAGIYLLAKLLGLALFETTIVTYDREVHDQKSVIVWSVQHGSTVALALGSIMALGLLLFVLERLLNAYLRYDGNRSVFLQAWAIRLLVVAAVGVLALWAVPELLRLISLVTATSRSSGLNGTASITQGSAFLATVTGLVGLVKTTLRSFKNKLQTGKDGTTSIVESWTGRALKVVSPWIGSVLVLALLLAALLVWTASAAYNGLQQHEYVWMAVAVVGTVAWQGLTDINRNSIHPFYKQRLSSAFAVRRFSPDRTEDAPMTSFTEAEEIPYRTVNSFSALTGEKPELVICAAVNTDQQGVVPSGRGCAPFTFSPNYTGISSGQMFGGERGSPLMRTTKSYEKAAGPRLLTLPGAMAVSGAAVSPVMGRMSRRPLRLLLGVANVRLGLWLPNPRSPKWPVAEKNPGPAGRESFWRMVARQFQQPGIPCLLREIFGRISLDHRWIYVTDGGHYENLGLVEALRRGATEIVVFDASGDPPRSWQAFGEAVETARTDLGVEIDLDPTRMSPPDGKTRAPILTVRGECHYPDGRVATLHLCKLALPETAKASWDVFAWAAAHDIFPHDPTTDQLYGDREFEAYRRLGEIAAEMALEDIYGKARKPIRALAIPRTIAPLAYAAPKSRGATTHKSTVAGRGRT